MKWLVRLGASDNRMNNWADDHQAKLSQAEPNNKKDANDKS